MEEYMALVSMGQRFGTPWRPMEQGLVENVHKTTQSIMGMLVRDVADDGGSSDSDDGSNDVVHIANVHAAQGIGDCEG